LLSRALLDVRLQAEESVMLDGALPQMLARFRVIQAKNESVLLLNPLK